MVMRRCVRGGGNLFGLGIRGDLLALLMRRTRRVVRLYCMRASEVIWERQCRNARERAPADYAANGQLTRKKKSVYSLKCLYLLY